MVFFRPILFVRRGNLSSAYMIEVLCNDRVGKRVKVKCLPDDTIGEFKLQLAAQIGTPADRIVLKKGYIVFKDHITLADYEIHDGSNLELYYS